MKASIVIPVLNNLLLTQVCLESVFVHSDGDTEIIIIDNASDSPTREYLQDVAKASASVRVIRNALNLGFPIAASQGMAAASGDVIVLLNNDTQVTPGWLDRLLAPFADRKVPVGLVGPMSDNVSGPQSVGHRADWHKAAERLATVKAGHYRFTSRLVGFCLAIRREVVSQLGGLDPRFGLGNFDDDDYCLRAQLAGWKLVIAEDCFVHHAGHATFDAERIDFDVSMHVNRKMFLYKWRSLGLQGNSLAEMAQGTVDAKDLFIALPEGTPAISLCMIVRNEEQYLEDCLRSVQGAVDEIVIVDTGSTDGTMDIARRFGAKIREVPWQDDFAAARNASLEMATCDWILVLDADERLAEHSIEELRRMSFDPLPQAFVCSVRGNESTAASPVLRFFRNTPSIRYKGRLHEQPGPLDRDRVFNSAVTILHRGYAPDVVKARDKIQRNLHLALKDAEDAQDYHAFFNLARVYGDLGQHDQAERYAAKARQLAVDPEDDLNAAFLEIGAAARKDIRTAIVVARELVRTYPGMPRVVFTYGRMLAAAQRWQEAMDALDWRRDPDVRAALSCAFLPQGVAVLGTGLRSACLLYAKCADELGMPDRAVQYVQDAIAVLPVPDAGLWRILADLLAEQNHWQAAGEALNRGLKLAPLDWANWRFMAEICRKVGRDDLATEAEANVAKLAA